MPVPVQELFEETLAKNDRKDALYRAAIGGWEDYKASTEFGRWKRKATRAHIVWERMIDRALYDLDEKEGVQVLEENDTVSFVFDEQIFVRFKKGNSNKISNNYPTKLALAYHKHNRDLFGFEGVQRAEIVYVLNERETEVEGVYVVARNNKKVIWDFELESANANVEALPITPQNPVPSKKRLVRLKGVSTEEVGKKASGDDPE